MSNYKVGSNQYKKTTKKDVGMYMIGFLYLMIFFVLLHDINILTSKHADASETVPSMMSPLASPAASLRIVDTASTSAEMSKPLTREEKLKVFLESKNSPLASYSDYIVKVSDENDISWTLIVSISGKESSFGVHIKPQSFNAWGIMSWDDSGKRFIREFKSWKEAILFEAKLLSNSYRLNMNKAIQEKYCPSFECSNTWVENVTSFQKEINK